MLNGKEPEGNWFIAKWRNYQSTRKMTKWKNKMAGFATGSITNRNRLARTASKSANLATPPLADWQRRRSTSKSPIRPLSVWPKFKILTPAKRAISSVSRFYSLLFIYSIFEILNLNFFQNKFFNFWYFFLKIFFL